MLRHFAKAPTPDTGKKEDRTMVKKVIKQAEVKAKNAMFLEAIRALAEAGKLSKGQVKMSENCIKTGEYEELPLIVLEAVAMRVKGEAERKMGNAIKSALRDVPAAYDGQDEADSYDVLSKVDNQEADYKAFELKVVKARDNVLAFAEQVGMRVDFREAFQQAKAKERQNSWLLSLEWAILGGEVNGKEVIPGLEQVQSMTRKDWDSTFEAWELANELGKEVGFRAIIKAKFPVKRKQVSRSSLANLEF